MEDKTLRNQKTQAGSGSRGKEGIGEKRGERIEEQKKLATGGLGARISHEDQNESYFRRLNHRLQIVPCKLFLKKPA